MSQIIRQLVGPVSHRGPHSLVASGFSTDRCVAYLGDPNERAKQSFADECNVNLIVARFDKTGVLPGGSVEPQYLDVSDVPDYRMSLDIVRRAGESFMSQSAQVRRMWDNDPAVMMAWLADPANLEESVKLGLRNAPPPVPEVPPVVLNPSGNVPLPK